MDSLNLDINQWIAAVSSFTGLLTAIAAFLAIRQATKHREASYRPELLIERTPFRFKSVNGDSAMLGFDYWQNSDGSPSEDDQRKWLVVPFVNVGLGAAKWVDVEWSMPIAKVVDRVNHEAVGAELPKLFRYDNGCLTLLNDGKDLTTHFWRSQRSVRLDSVLPKSQGGQLELLVVPPAYCFLVTALVWLGAKSGDRRLTDDLPSLEVKIEYSDIGGKRRKTKLRLHTNIALVGGEAQEILGSVTTQDEA